MRARPAPFLRPSLQARRGVGRSASGQRRALDSAGSRPALARGGHGRGPRDGGLGGGHRRAHAARRAEGSSRRHRGSGPLGSRGGARPGARALVLVPLPRRGRGLAGGPHSHRAPPGPQPERLRFAFASCQHWEFRPLRGYHHMLADELDLVVHMGTTSPSLREEAAGAPPRSPEATDSELSAALRALQERQGPAGGAPAHPWIVTLGRSRVSTTTPATGRNAATPTRFPAARAGPIRRTTSTCRCGLHPAPRSRLRSIGTSPGAGSRTLRARRPPVSRRAALGEGRAAAASSWPTARSAWTRPDPAGGRESVVFDGLGRVRSRWTVLARAAMAQLRQRDRAAPNPTGRTAGTAMRPRASGCSRRSAIGGCPIRW